MAHESYGNCVRCFFHTVNIHSTHTHFISFTPFHLKIRVVLFRSQSHAISTRTRCGPSGALSLSLCISPSSTISLALSQSAGSGSGVWDWAAATVAPHVAPSRLLNGLFYYVDYYWRFFFSFFSGFCGYLIWLCSLGELCVEFLLISLTPQWLKIKCMRCV